MNGECGFGGWRKNHPVKTLLIVIVIVILIFFVCERYKLYLISKNFEKEYEKAKKLNNLDHSL